MNRTFLITLLGVLSLCLLCGCPRTSDEGTAGGGTTETTPAAGQTADTQDEAAMPEGEADNPCGEDENPCADADNPCGEEMPDGEGDNPCADTANPCADADNPCADGEDAVEDEVTTVVLETTDGDIVLEVHSAWSPLGAPHFLELVEAGYYDGAPWFRVIDGFMAQTGISDDPELNREWGRKTIMDDPVVVGNKRGFVSFGTSGPNSRTTHFFINFGDNTGPPAYLDRQGFSAFAQVVEGMDVVDGLHRIPDGPPGSGRLGDSTITQGSLATAAGFEQFQDHFKEADYIKRAYIRE